MAFLNLVLAILGLFNLTFTQFQDTEGTAALNEEWSGWGGNIYNNRYAASNRYINSTIDSLVLRCRLKYEHGVSATPIVHREETTIYFPTWGGLFIALDYTTCLEQWKINVTEVIVNFSPILTPQISPATPAPASRTSPQLDGDVLYFGTLLHALVVATNRRTGQILGIIQANPHPLAIVTMSPNFYSEYLFVGTASSEESAADLLPSYPCCSFVGNMLSLQFDHKFLKFSINWNITMIPESKGGVNKWSGAAIWGSQPSIDTERGHLFVGTGNKYAVPKEYEQCQNKTIRVNATSDSCLPNDIWQNSVVAIDINTGHVKWTRQIGPLDAWTTACGIAGTPISHNSENCPQIPGPDADFGMAPAFVPGNEGATPSGQDVVIIGQKNGNLYALSAENGGIFWATATSPDGLSGGLSWGIAADGTRVYFTAINSQATEFLLQPENKMTNSSAYGAASLLNGSLLWETTASGDGQAFGPPTVVGDLVLSNKPVVTSMGSPRPVVQSGGLVILSAATGHMIGQISIDRPVHGGVTVQDEYVMFGTGYNGYDGTGALWVFRTDTASYNVSS